MFLKKYLKLLWAFRILHPRISCSASFGVGDHEVRRVGGAQRVVVSGASSGVLCNATARLLPTQYTPSPVSLLIPPPLRHNPMRMFGFGAGFADVDVPNEIEQQQQQQQQRRRQRQRQR